MKERKREKKRKRRDEGREGRRGDVANCQDSRFNIQYWKKKIEPSWTTHQDSV